MSHPTSSTTAASLRQLRRAQERMNNQMSDLQSRINYLRSDTRERMRAIEENKRQIADHTAAIEKDQEEITIALNQITQLDQDLRELNADLTQLAEAAGEAWPPENNIY